MIDLHPSAQEVQKFNAMVAAMHSALPRGTCWEKEKGNGDVLIIVPLNRTNEKKIVETVESVRSDFLNASLGLHSELRFYRILNDKGAHLFSCHTPDQNKACCFGIRPENYQPNDHLYAALTQAFGPPAENLNQPMPASLAPDTNPPSESQKNEARQRRIEELEGQILILKQRSPATSNSADTQISDLFEQLSLQKELEGLQTSVQPATDLVAEEKAEKGTEPRVVPEPERSDKTPQKIRIEELENQIAITQKRHLDEANSPEDRISALYELPSLHETLESLQKSEKPVSDSAPAPQDKSPKQLPGADLEQPDEAMRPDNVRQSKDKSNDPPSIT